MPTPPDAPTAQTAADIFRRATIVALAAAALDLVILAALHVLQPGVDPMTEPTSAYVHGRGGMASQVGTFAAGIGALALLAAVAPRRSGRGTTVGLGFLGIFGLTKLLQAFYPIDPEGTSTASGTVHNLLGNLAFFTLPVAAILVGAAVSRMTRQRPPVILGLLVAITTVGVLAAGALDVFGLAQRVYLITAALWVAVCALALRSSEADPA